MRLALALLAAACLAVAGCAATPAAGPLASGVAAAASSDAAGRAERVAEALVEASLAERAADPAALQAAAQRLERLGAAPQEEAGKAMLARWFAALPADAPPMRGRALGPAFRAAVLDPGTATELNQTFLGGRAAQIVVRSVRGRAPRLVVQDQANREVCKAADDPVKCRWVPLYTQRHRIQIANTGPEVAEFYIVFD